MKTLLPSTLTMAATALLSTPDALAQFNEVLPSARYGMAAAWPAGISIDSDDPAFVDDNETLLKTGAPARVGTGHWTPTLHVQSPDYSIDAMFGVDTDIAIDAHSTGNGVMPRMLNGSSFPPPTTDVPWLAIFVSVSKSSGGLDRSHFRRAADAHAHAGSEIVGYYFEGSTGIDRGLVGKTLLETSGPQHNFDPSITGDLPDIDALDFGMGVLTFNQVPSPTTSIFFNNHDQYYFSVSNAWAMANPAPIFAHSKASPGTMVQPDGGTVYLIEWTGTDWSTPTEFLTPGDLHLLPGADLDAIEVDTTSNTYLFSTVPGPSSAPSQIMFTQSGSNTMMIPVPLPGAYGTTSSTAEQKIRIDILEDDNVDSICAADPESSIPGRYVGIANDNSIEGPDPMGLSMSRFEAPPVSDLGDFSRHDMVISGWGEGTAAAGFVVIEFFNAPNRPTSMSSETLWQPIRVLARTSTDERLNTTFDFPDFGDGNLVPIYFRARGFKHTQAGAVPNGETWVLELRL